MAQHVQISLTLGLALWAGVMTLSLARALKVPPLLFYILVGVVLGPSGLGWVRPRSLGEGLPILVEFGVAFILFEGALHLPRMGAHALPPASRRLLGLTMPLTALLSALTARALGGLNWLPAVCFGAMVVVTGPTTIGPLLKNLSLGRRLEVLFRQEAIWGDCLGILLAGAILPFWISTVARSVYSVPYELAERAILAALLGVGLGVVLGRWLLPALAKLGDPDLPGMVSLGSAALAFGLGQAFSPGSGPIASAVAGFTLALQKTPYTREVRAFKGQIAYLFIAMFFVLLSALIDLGEALPQLPSLALVALLIGLVVRPVSVLLGLAKSDLPWRERWYVALVGPRGIVALATASYALTQLPEDPQAKRVFTLTFLVIFFSGTFATLFGKPWAKILRVTVPEPRTGVLIIGANPFTIALALALGGKIQVRIVDSDPAKVATTIAVGLEGIRGDGVSEALYEDAAEQGFRRVLAATPNDTLNRAILETAEHIMGRNRVFRIPNMPADHILKDHPHLRHQIAFDERFALSQVLASWPRWRIAERAALIQGQIALASVRPDGFRFMRAKGTGKPPFLVLERADA